VTARELLRDVADSLQSLAVFTRHRASSKVRYRQAAALRTLADRIDAEIRATEGDEAESRANVIRAILLARLDAPPTEPAPAIPEER
jgi:hypothetical protein